MQKLTTIFLAGLLIFLVDLYVFQAVRLVMQELPGTGQAAITGLFWGWSAFTFITLVLALLSRGTPPTPFRTYWATVLFIVFASKLVVILFLFLEDTLRLMLWLIPDFPGDSTAGTTPLRSPTWSKVALLAGAIPFTAFIYGMAFGAFHYKIKHILLTFPNLPPAFQGFKMVQISDLHTGSFSTRKPLEKAVKLINAQQADVVFFTGDLVNNVATEVEPYIPVLGQLRAKEGVFSVLGNHDYGDYVRWPNRLAKIENLERLKHTHARMGWRLLINEHVKLERNGEKIGILGVENWGNRAGFPKYGKLYKAHQGTEELPFKVLLSHDPSHWDGEVNTKFPDVDLMLSGHTHGMQFGFNFKFFRWSPVQYVYKQWSGLYRKGSQYLYVNVGLGFLGYPGRVGFRPEITVFELRHN
ncbi:metallophosphoesterase [Adhaeribacter sp. BT258]|uniref:Metallophosphoesterase n=1 Tax=Adhaeribacter terrigena TaxID=2793070 RepID=A0ABS1C4I9_9BACT|nr:metallophosphoesterase [Adhaeribacter terrigena]MBK0404092.1 metallophosphoesterase [Adhaeribacter terrigena]